MTLPVPQIRIHDLDFELFITKREIYAIIRRMASDINRQLNMEETEVIVVMDGAAVFASDLLKSVKGLPQITYLSLKSYKGLKSTGVVDMENLQMDRFTNREILILEDIIDTGNTIRFLTKKLSEHGVKSIKIASLLTKPDIMPEDLKPDFVGLKIPPDFVVGYGLDYEGLGRNLDAIYRQIK